MFSRVSRPMIIALIVACALFMENLDGTIITTALPAMARSFGDSAVHLSLGVTAYMVSLAIFIPVSGWVADRWGARTVFRAAIAIFTIGSMLCGLCNNLGELAAARVLQGIGGAMMVPVGRLVMLRSVEKSELVLAMAYLSVPAMIGPVLGPPVGGFITTYFSWRWVFFLNLPIGILGITLVTLLIENYREVERPPLDWLGLLLTGGSLASLMYGFDLVGHPGSSGYTWSLLAAGLAIGVLAVWHSRRHPHPLIDISLLRVPTFAITISGGSLYRLTMGAIPFLLPLMLQVGFGESAFASGLLTFGAAAGSLAMKATARVALRRFGFRTVFIGNGLICSASILVCALFTASTPAALIFTLLLVGGFFRSLQYTGLNAMAYADISSPRMSAATSFSSMMQQLSNGMGVALGALVLQVAINAHGAGGAGIPVTGDFHAAFLVVGLLSLISVLFFLRLKPDDGAEVTGHVRRGARAGSQIAESGD